MKKLMFAAAAIAAGVAMADVTSANVVGYNTTDNSAEEDSFMFGASFQCVGEGEKILLQDLSSPQGIEDGDQIQMPFDDPETGLLNAKIYEYWDGDGWVDVDSSEVVGDTVGLELSQGAWYLAKEAGKTITTSGQVKKTSHIHTFTETSVVTASAFPTPFKPNNENVSWGCDDGDQLQVPFVDESGLLNAKIYEFWDGDGWVDIDSSEVLDSDQEITTAGKAFWFLMKDPSSTFSEVSPIAE